MKNIEKKFYPDGSFYPVINKFEANITFRINNYNDLWFLKQIKDVYDNNLQPLDVHIPCLLDAQADRRFNGNESANLKLVCRFLNDMKFNFISVFHPHNPEVVEALIDGVVIVDNKLFIQGVLNLIAGPRYDYDFSFIQNNTILMSTDAGGFKPLMKLCDQMKWKGGTYSASKSRSYDGEKSNLYQTIDKHDFEGKDILIVDDLCVYGGTFLGLASILQKRNIGNLYLAISHLTMKSPKKELEKYYKQIYTTNSKGYDYDLNNLIIIQ